MSLLDYHPLLGPLREANGTATDGESGNDSFIDQATGQEIDGAYYACGACDHVPIRDGDSSCPSCGEPVDWGQDHPDSFTG